MAEIRQNVPLQALNSMALKAQADYYLHAENLDDIHQALDFSRRQQLPLIILGAGSNSLLPAQLHGLVLHMASRGIALQQQHDDSFRVRVAAGENWDDFLRHCLSQHWYGLENLALIPGTVGAAPIQNIGAYGQEVADCIAAVEVLDLHSGQLQTLDHGACQFGYRDSLFRRQPGRYLIIAVHFLLQRQFSANLSYRALADYCQNLAPDAMQLRQAVIALRSSKLPDPAQLPNCGSFFKNPVIASQHYQQLLQRYPAMPSYPQSDGRIKLPAAWLIEQCGWRGKRHGALGMYSQQALVMVNYGGADYHHVAEFSRLISADVQQRFAITLEREPVLAGQSRAGD